MRKGLVLFFIAGALEGAVWIRTYDVGSTETLISASTTSDGGFILLGSRGDSVLLIKLDSLISRIRNSNNGRWIFDIGKEGFYNSINFRNKDK